jgi:putative flippase GtrA
MRFVRFNGVGAVGFAVQLASLTLMLKAGVPYLVATAIAVEASVLNNFVWHDRWTWRDRPCTGRARLWRLGRFHALNGLVSLGGNLLIVSALVGNAGMSPIAANVIAVLACGILNYFGADRLVFENGDQGPGTRNQESAITDQNPGKADQELAIRSADLSARATNVSVAFVQPPVGSVGDPATNRFS